MKLALEIIRSETPCAGKKQIKGALVGEGKTHRQQVLGR